MRKFTLLFALMLLSVTAAMAEAVAELGGKYIAIIGSAVSQVESGQWYLLRNNGRSAYVVKESDALRMRQASPAGTKNYGYLFKIEATGKEGVYTIKTYEGDYISIGYDTSSTTTEKNTFKIGNISGTYFYMQQTSDNRVADGQRVDDFFVGWSDTAPTGTGGNSSYQFIPVTLGDFNVTYKYNIGGREYTTRTAYVESGSMPSAPAVDFVTIKSLDKTDAITSDVTINVDCDENLPFVASKNYAKARWHFIDMHSNDSPLGNSKNYVWTYDAPDVDVKLPKVDVKQSTKPTDNEMWAFVGNLIDGFKIYNKAAGEGLTLRKAANGNTPAVMSSTDDRNLFKLFKSTAITGAAAFKLDGDDSYVNTQAVNGTKVLRGWNEADGGSSCRFFTPTHYLLANLDIDLGTIFDNADDIVALAETGALGVSDVMNSEDLTYLASAYTLVYNPDNLNAEEMMAKINNVNALIDAPVTVEEGKLYRLKNFCRILPNDNPLDDFNGGYVSYEPTNAANFSCHTRGKDQAGAIFKFEAVEGGYKIYDLNGKGYVGKTNATQASQYVSLTTNAEEAGIFEIKQLPLGQFNFICKNSGGTIDETYLHASGSGIMNWVDGGASKFFIIPAVDIERPLSEVNGKYYATAYLPFAVSATGTTKLYTAQQNASNADVVNAIETAQIPAEQGFIIEGTEGTATLNITDNAAEVTGNVLSGTLQNKDGITKADYYILGNGDNGLGFYHPNSTTLVANKAFIAPTAAQAASLRLNFGGNVTGINGATIDGAGQNQPIYDLSGRRVEKATKGIYIQGGKKILVK